jgi:hypothetical protein
MRWSCSHNDGPWQVPENYRKLNGVLRYSQGSANDGWSVTGMAYRRPVDLDRPGRPAGYRRRRLIRPLRLARPDDRRQDAYRYSLSADWARRGKDSQSAANVWALDYKLDLYSNFTYCAADFAANWHLR